MGLLGKNLRGEEVYATAEGGRYVMRNGKVTGELSSPTGYKPYSLFSDERYRTVLEAVEANRRLHDTGIDGIGATAAIAAMMPYWETHLAEGHGPDIITRDLEEVKRRIDSYLEGLKATLDMPGHPN